VKRSSVEGGRPRHATTRNLPMAVYMESEVRALAKAVRAPWRKNVLEYVFTL
jgi:spore germination cell wall hydrolase CwlJ-like protein